MVVSYANYILMIIGILTIFAAVFLILVDKLKGEDMYFNLDVKEQELKKIIEDAEEIISELNYLSDVVVQEIEDKMKSLQQAYNSVRVTPIIQEVKQQAAAIPVTIKSKAVVEKPAKEKSNEVKLNTKQQAVFDLAEQGMSVVDIAKRLNMGQGEVKLILSIKNDMI